MRSALRATLLCLVVAVCGGNGGSGAEPSTTVAATTSSTTSTSQATTTTTIQPTTTSTTTTVTLPPTITEATTPTSVVSDEQLAKAAGVGDIAAGEELFSEPLAEMPDSVSCSSCHSVDGRDTPWAPTLAGISAVAADRVDGMSDVDYLRQSIVDPFAFRVAGEWAFPMPIRYSDALSEEQIDNPIAFMLTPLAQRGGAPAGSAL